MAEHTAFDATDRAEAIAARAKLPRDLYGGTATMRAAGSDYLPQWPLEPLDAWRSRKNSTFLFGGYKRAHQTAVGKAFGDNIRLEDDVPVEIRGQDDAKGQTRIEGLWENIDYAGSHGDVFCQWVFADSLHVGIGHILVEYPVADGVQTLADERQAGLRPYWVYVPGDAVLGWRDEQVNGKTRLTQFRYLEVTVQEDGQFGEKAVERARVYYASDAENPYARFEVYGKNEKEEVELVGGGPLSPHTEIPLSTFYARKTGFMTGAPFLEEVAWSNLELWQSGSEQRNMLHFARVPFYGFFGFADDEYKAVTAIGASARVRAKDTGARVEIIEGRGVAMGEGWKDIDRLKSEITALSLEPLVSGLVAETAMGRAIDEARAHSALEAAIRNMEDCIEDALGNTAVWLGLDYSAGGSVQMTERLSPLADGAQKFQGALDLFKQGAIGKRELLDRAVAFGVLDEETDVDKLIEEREAEAADNFAAFQIPAEDRELPPTDSDGAGAEGVAA